MMKINSISCYLVEQFGVFQYYVCFTLYTIMHTYITVQKYMFWNSTPTHPRLPPKNPRRCCLKIHLYILTEVQNNIRNRFQHVVHAAVTIWDYLFHGILGFQSNQSLRGRFGSICLVLFPLLTVVMLPTYFFFLAPHCMPIRYLI